MSDGVGIFDSSNENCEKICYNNNSLDISYEAILDLNDIKNVLEGFTEQYITINFGDHQAIVISVGNVYNVIPEVSVL